MSSGESRREEDPLRWRVLERVPGEDYRIFHTERRVCAHPESGAERAFAVLHMADWANIIALTRNDNVVMVRQYRHGTDAVTLEIPGGVIDEGETHGAAAERELLEETGYRADKWLRLGTVEPNPAIQDNAASTWLALDAERVDAPRPDPGEVLAVEEVPLARIPELLRDGTIRHAIVVAAFTHLLLRTGGRFERPKVDPPR